MYIMEGATEGQYKATHLAALIPPQFPSQAPQRLIKRIRQLAMSQRLKVCQETLED